MDLDNLDFEAVDRKMEIDEASQCAMMVPEDNAPSEVGCRFKGAAPNVAGRIEVAA